MQKESFLLDYSKLLLMQKKKKKKKSLIGLPYFVSEAKT